MIFFSFEPERMEPNAKPILFIYIFFSIFLIYFTILLYKKWKSKRKKPAQLLFITFLSFTITILGLLVGFIEMFLTGLKLKIYRFSLGFGYFFNCIGNIFLMEFISELFSIPKKFIRKYQVLMIFIAIIVILPWNYYGWPQYAIDLQPIPSIRVYSQLSLFIVSLLVYGRISIVAYHASKLVQDKYLKISFKFISYSHISEIIFYVCMSLDSISFTFFDLPGYSIFVFIAWIFGFFFFIFCYIGYIMPQWLIKIKKFN